VFDPDSKMDSRSRLIVPDGQITDWPVQPFSQKYSGSLLTQITSTTIAIPHPREGRFAIVTDVGRGMRWTRGALLTRALTLRTAKSCGPDASMVGVKLVKEISLATVTIKPDHRGELEGNR
jgi:hypothetical protein